MGGRRDWRKEKRAGKREGRERGREGEGGTCSKVLGGDRRPCVQLLNLLNQTALDRGQTDHITILASPNP